MEMGLITVEEQRELRTQVIQVPSSQCEESSSHFKKTALTDLSTSPFILGDASWILMLTFFPTDGEDFDWRSAHFVLPNNGQGLE